MAMAAKRVAVVSVLSLLWTLSTADTEVVCVFMETCVLPCSFQNGSDLIIHWTLMNSGHSSVHTYYFNREQLEQQDLRFRGRTSLFQDQISRGNASLRLTEVQVQDEGRYKCYTDTSHPYQESFVSLRVDAPVQRVDIQQERGRITCSSGGIYPEPNLTWTTRPPSNLVLRSTTIVQRSRQQLYNISSSLIPSHNDTHLAYTCTVSTRSNWKRRETPSSPAKPNFAIAQVIGVILVTISMGLVPCFYHKCKKLQSNIRTNCLGETKVV